MPWTNWKDRFKHAQDGAGYYIGRHLTSAKHRLTHIAKAIYARQMVKDQCEGLSVLNHLPEFFKISHETTALLKSSAKTNFLFYLIPVILYFRFFSNVLPTLPLYQFFPDIRNINPYYMDWTLWALKYGAIAVTIFAIQAKSNFVVYVPSYPRTIANDINEFLPILIANEMTKEYGALFDEMFRMKGEYQTFNSKLKEKFRKFFSTPIKSKKSLSAWEKELSILFAEMLKEQPTSQFDDFNNKLSHEIAVTIMAEFEKIFESNTNTLNKNNHDSLQELLLKPFDQKTAKYYANEFRRRIADIHAKFQTYLPVEYYPSCGCKKTQTKIRYLIRTSSAVVSNPFYYLFNILLTQLTELSWSFVVSPDKFFWLSCFFTMVRMLNAGLSLASMKITQSPHCKAHLDQILMGNKAYGLGVGALQVLVVEAIALFIYLCTDVRNFFTNDAINQFVSQIFAIAMLTNKGLLPGKKLDAWNVFFVPKELFRLVVRFITWLYAPNPEKTQENLAFWNNLKYYLTSNALYKIVKFILQPKSFFIKNDKLIRSGENTLDVLFDDAEICELLRRFREDLQSFLDWIIPFQDKVQTINSISQKLIEIKNYISSYITNKYFAYYLNMVEQFIAYFIDLSAYQKKADVLANLLLPILADESLKVFFKNLQAKLHNMDTQTRQLNIEKVEAEFEAKIIPFDVNIKALEIKDESKKEEPRKEDPIKEELKKEPPKIDTPKIETAKIETAKIEALPEKIPTPTEVIFLNQNHFTEKAYTENSSPVESKSVLHVDVEVSSFSNSVNEQKSNTPNMIRVCEPVSPPRQTTKQEVVHRRPEPSVVDTLMKHGMWGFNRLANQAVKQVKKTTHEVRYALKNKPVAKTHSDTNNSFELQSFRKVSSPLK